MLDIRRRQFITRRWLRAPSNRQPDKLAEHKQDIRKVFYSQFKRRALSVRTHLTTLRTRISVAGSLKPTTRYTAEMLYTGEPHALRRDLIPQQERPATAWGSAGREGNSQRAQHF